MILYRSKKNFWCIRWGNEPFIFFSDYRKVCTIFNFHSNFLPMNLIILYVSICSLALSFGSSLTGNSCWTSSIFTEKQARSSWSGEQRIKREKAHLLWANWPLCGLFFSFPQILMQAKRSFTSTWVINSWGHWKKKWEQWNSDTSMGGLEVPWLPLEQSYLFRYLCDVVECSVTCIALQ